MTTVTNSTTSDAVTSPFSALDALAPHAHWLLRFGLASVFLYHGLTKFPNLAGLAEMMAMPVFMIGMLAVVEVLGGALILIGGFTKDILTRLGGLLLVPPMLGAIMMVHWGQWSFVASDTHPMGGMEFQVVLLMLALFFVVRGNKPA